MEQKLSADKIICNRCGSCPEIVTIDSGSMYKGVRCDKCNKVECLNCKGLPPDRPCSWCGGKVSPIGYVVEKTQSTAKFIDGEQSQPINIQTDLGFEYIEMRMPELTANQISEMREAIYKSVADIVGSRALATIPRSQASIKILTDKFLLDKNNRHHLVPDKQTNQLGNIFFKKLTAMGDLAIPRKPPVEYQLIGGVSPGIQDYILYYANCIAHMRQVNISLEMINIAYQYFLHDLKHFFEEIGIIFNPGEKLIDWQIVVAAVFEIKDTNFFLVTDQRLCFIRNRQIKSEISYCEAETLPKKINPPDSQKVWVVDPFTNVFTTNQRLIKFQWTIGIRSQFEFFHQPLPDGANVRQLYHSKKTNLLLALTEKNLLVWTAQKMIETIQLSNINNIQINKNTLILYYPEKREYEIKPEKNDGSTEFVANVRSILGH